MTVDPRSDARRVRTLPTRRARPQELAGGLWRLGFSLLVTPMLLALLATSAAALELNDCRINAGPAYPSLKARCGRLSRPLNPADPAGQQIELNVVVVPALSLEPATDPIVPIAGGPGQGTVDFYAGSFSAFEMLRRERDILLVDQRGTGQSAPMNCSVADEDPILPPNTRERAIDAARACLDELPYDPRYFTTSVAVTDLEAVREALGYSSLNIYGVSYGSRVAQHFARRYPASTRTVVLDGVVPATLALGPDIPLQAQQAVERIFSRCAEDAACGNAFPDVAKSFERLRAELDDAPVSLAIPHPKSNIIEVFDFGAEEFAGAVRLLAYHPSTIALLPFLVDSAARGQLEPLAMQFLTVRDSLDDMLAMGMHNAVMCTEDAPFFDQEPVTDEALAATYIGPVMLESLEAMCSVWPAGVLDEDFKSALNSDLPVLLLSGDADPITPPAYATQAAELLTNKHEITGVNQGHGLAPRGCTPQIMADFVDAASIAGLDDKDDCLEAVFAMPFFLGFGGPAP